MPLLWNHWALAVADIGLMPHPTPPPEESFHAYVLVLREDVISQYPNNEASPPHLQIVFGVAWEV